MLSIDITIGNNTQRVNFMTDNPIEEQSNTYYVGWTDITTDLFAGLPVGQLLQMAEKRTSKDYSGSFGKYASVFFLLYQPDKIPTVTFTSAGVPMQQDIVEDNICPHDDVSVEGVTYKVFGVRIYQPDQTDTITIKY